MLRSSNAFRVLNSVTVLAMLLSVNYCLWLATNNKNVIDVRVDQADCNSGET